MPRKKKRRGRPPHKKHRGLLTESLMKRIARHVAKGNYLKTACAIENIAEDTARNWLTEGRKDFTEDNIHPKTAQGKFAKAISLAYAKAELRAQNQIQKGINRSWLAAAWWLTHGPRKDHWVGKQPGVMMNAKINIQDQIAPRLSAMTGKILEAEYTQMDTNLKMIEETASASRP